ncbi:MAG TPA: hypothetical protein VMD31_07620 [Opitutaceae bacterium]|nr:hypothetical protein [Opitutaceae bacterium]
MIRKGAKMAAAIEFVKENPRCTKMAAAAAVGPNGSLRFGYAVVDRALKAGFIGAVPVGRRYELYHIHDL